MVSRPASQPDKGAARRDVIAKLVELQDKRAIKPIKRARNRRRGGFLGIGGRRMSPCLTTEADEAIAQLSALEK